MVESLAVSRQPRGGTDERWSCCGGLRRRPGGTNHADLLFHPSNGGVNHMERAPQGPRPKAVYNSVLKLGTIEARRGVLAV